MISPARHAAYGALLSIERGRADLPSALARVRRAKSDVRDQALAHEIITATERWRGRLDYVIARFADRPVERMDPEVRTILRLSAYQLHFLERVPARAVVDDAVALTRSVGKTSAAGFVNAVLRAIAKESHAPQLPARPQKNADLRDEGGRSAALQYLSVSLSHPGWLAERLLDRLSFPAAEAWELFNNSTPRLSLSVNTLKADVDAVIRDLDRHGITVERTRYSPVGLTVISGNPLRSPLADTGVFFVQDEASQLVGQFSGVTPGERVLDACAAPGGKTVEMAGLMKDDGLLVAADYRVNRLPLLLRSVALSGARAVHVVRLDLTKPVPFRDSFDCVLVDAPCSGLGTLRRDPDIRWRRTPADLPRLAATQLGQLTQAAAAVRVRGRLVYATCSSEPEENDDVVLRFLEEHPVFQLRDPRSLGLTPSVPDVVFDAQGCLRTQPHQHQLEAFFAAMLVRTA